MPEPPQIIRAGEYFIAVQGLAMMRYLITNPSMARKRMDDVQRIVERFDRFPQSLEIPVTEYDVEAGYTRWAPNYDAPNPAIEREEPLVRRMVSDLPRGAALDAACGTGRHAAILAGLGYDVVGVDATPAMLEIALAKVPGVDFRIGRLDALPVENASVDLVTCALALTHVPRLDPVVREFARVLRPGGHAVISDIHPFTAMTSGVAAIPAEDGGLAEAVRPARGSPVLFVQNLVHHLSEYVQAFLGNGFSILDCQEPLVTEEMLPRFPSYAAYPEATREAFLDAPYLVIWHVVRS